MKFFLPSSKNRMERDAVELTAEKTSDTSPLLAATLPSNQTLQSGVYDLLATTNDGNLEVRRFAVNIDASESDLTRMESKQLLANLDPVKPRFIDAERYSGGYVQQQGFNRSMLLMTLLILFLVGEQLLAYSASYHPAPTRP